MLTSVTFFSWDDTFLVMVFSLILYYEAIYDYVQSWVITTLS